MTATTPILDLRDLPPVEENVPRPATASQTLLAHVDRCARSAYLYVKYRGSVQTAQMARGEVGHAGFERITNMAIEAGEVSVPAEVGKETMLALIEERRDLALPEFEQDALRVMGWNFASATRFDLASHVGTELMFVAEIGGWIVRGKIDRLEIAGTEAHVTDYKTSLNVQSKEDFEKKTFQTKLYGLLVAEGVLVPDDYEDAEDLDERVAELRELIANETPLGRGLSGFHLRETYPRYVREDDNTLVDRYLYMDRGQLHDFRRVVESHLATLDHGLETGEYRATPGEHCARCPARHECPLPEHLRGVKQIGSSGEASEVAVRASFMEDELTDLKKTLKGYADENGAIPAGTDREYSYKLQSSYSVRRKKKDDLIEFISAHDGDPDEFFEQKDSTQFRRRKVEAE